MLQYSARRRAHRSMPYDPQGVSGAGLRRRTQQISDEVSDSRACPILRRGGEMRRGPAFAVIALATACVALTSELAVAQRSQRIQVVYEAPTNPAHQAVHDTLKNARVLE